MENFIVSARKYRPVTFDMVVGQQSITSTLKNAIRNNTLAQAFLFTGPRGVGKTTCARIMAKTINCFNPTPEMEACDQCESCVSFNRSASFNIHELDAASNNSVDDIRNLVDQVRIPPQVGAYKIYIIDEVHMLSAAAFNAFLKTLEEPPSYAKFILATTEKHKIIPTILSRCQIFDFKRITLEDISKHLEYVAAKESVNAEAEALAIIAQKADGALRDALSIFDQMVSFSGKTITYKDVIANLNVLDFDYYFSITESILQGNTSAVLLTLNEIIENGFDPQHFIHGMGSHLRSLLVSKNPETVKLMEVSKSLQERYADQAKTCSLDLLLNALDINNRCDINYRSSNNKRLHLEIALLQICGLANQQTHKVQATTSLPANKATAVPANPPTQKPAMPASPATSTRPQEKPAAGSSGNYAQPQSSAANTTEPQHVVREVSPGRARSTRTISISDTENKTEENSEEPEPETRGAFDQLMLTNSWKSFAETYKTVSPSFANAIGQYEPRLGEDFEIRFTIDNSLIASDKLNMNALFDHLKKAFNNNQLKLTPVVTDKPKELDAYTDKEKFEKMAKHRPHLLNLKQELNLETEF
ncbi:MAG: DNA polymerase III subunit gamma/tau [Bacteroidetes bacterium]|jgi:DNA polymerase-3 subunit gamma/tau|nr:DNA polymerase III subunit gamma/tau [Bacteroidota bacterium]